MIEAEKYLWLLLPGNVVLDVSSTSGRSTILRCLKGVVKPDWIIEEDALPWA